MYISIRFKAVFVLHVISVQYFVNIREWELYLNFYWCHSECIQYEQQHKQKN